MKLICPYFNTAVDVEEGEIFSLVIEEPSLFRRVVEDIHIQSGGDGGKIVLSKDSVPISFYKYADVIEKFAPFDINTKALLSKIASEIEKTALDGSHYLDSSRLISDIENYISELCFDLPFRVECSKLGIGAVIKAASVKVACDYQDPIEEIIAYMCAVLDFDRTKLFITVNMRSYFSDEDIYMFFEEVKKHQLSVLMIDNYARGTLDGMKSLIIDKDLCEF